MIKVWKAFVEDRSLMMILFLVAYVNIPIVRLFVHLYILLKILELLGLSLKGLCMFACDLVKTLMNDKKR